MIPSHPHHLLVLRGGDGGIEMTRTIRIGAARALALLAATLCFQWKCADAQTVDDTWIGSAGQWNVAANWSSGEPLNGTPPGATYNVAISNGGAVTMSNGLNSSTPIDNLTVGSSSSLSIVDGNNLTITGNTLANAGTIALNSGGHATYIGIDASRVTLSGGGTITMSNNANNYIVGSATADTLVNEETIQGSGSIGGGNGSISLTLVNFGVIDANQSAGMVIQANGGTTNKGTLESTAGATLYLSGTFTNSAGSILADASGLKLSNAIVNGGSVTLSGDSTLQLFGATIHGGSTLTNSATGVIEALVDSNNTLGGTVNNSAGGVIQIDDDATVNLEKGSYSSLGAVPRLLRTRRVLQEFPFREHRNRGRQPEYEEKNRELLPERIPRPVYTNPTINSRNTEPHDDKGDRARHRGVCTGRAKEPCES